MRVDAHQHFWVYAPAEYPWIEDDLALLRRDFLPEHLAPVLATGAIDATVLVQARQSLAETRFLLKLARERDFVAGVVGWVDLCCPDADAERRLEETLIAFADDPHLRGVRHIVQDEPDDAFVLRPDFQRGVRQLARFGLTYDLLVYPRQLASARAFVEAFPEQPFVLDHAAKPRIKDGLLMPWREELRALARHPNVCCKLSGLVTEAHWSSWRAEDFAPYLDVIYEAFGEERVLFGSDWPVCTLAASYEQVQGLLTGWAAGLSENAREKLFGLNAARFYSLDSA